MNSVVGSPVRSGDVISRGNRPEFSLFRLYALRIFYLVMAGGLGVYIWPAGIYHTNEFAATRGVQITFLAGLCATAAFGLRYPVQMLPLMLFELCLQADYFTS